MSGDVGAVTGTLWSMRSYGDSLREAGTGLARIDTHQGWQGEAADQFRSRFDGEPRKWTEAGDCFHSAADALDSYAGTLQWRNRKRMRPSGCGTRPRRRRPTPGPSTSRRVRRPQEEATGGTVPDILHSTIPAR